MSVAEKDGQVRSLLIGCGRWGRRLLTALRRHPAITVVAVVDTDPAALRRAAAEQIWDRMMLTSFFSGALADVMFFTVTATTQIDALSQHDVRPM